MERPEPLPSGDERQLAMGYVQYLRHTILWKCEGLTDEQLRYAHAPSAMTLGGMLAHLDFVEDYWINWIFLGEHPSEPWIQAPWGEDEDWDWHQVNERTGNDLREALVRRWEATDAAIADVPMEELSARHAGEHKVSLRWLLLHFMEEYGRHAGHADILREAIDGAVGE